MISQHARTHARTEDGFEWEAVKHLLDILCSANRLLKIFVVTKAS